MRSLSSHQVAGETDFGEEWRAREAGMVAAARRMERSLLVFLAGMLEGDADAQVAHIRKPLHHDASFRRAWH